MTSNSTVTYSSGAAGAPDLRFLHYNDVYHIEEGSRDPVGGAPRFVSLVNHYRNSQEFANQPGLLTFFSGDAFNPSLESSVTKGRHMVPILNKIKTDVACLGNHDLDFGVDQLKYLAQRCEFPWLIANVEDPALGEGVSIAGLQKTVMLESSNGLKVGVIGLAEREWLETINSLPPNLKYTSASAKAKELAPGLREQGADIIVVVSHQREPNDVKLAENIPEGLVDIILGGHDHYYNHQIVNGIPVLRSGSDFKQLSYIEARRKSKDGSVPGWNFDIIRRDITKDVPADEETSHIVDQLTSGLKAKLEKPIGHTAVPLDSRFSIVRCQESNIGNFVCDLMRFYYNADCTIMAGGTIRGDELYPPGIIKMKLLQNCFPFEDPVVVIRVPGKSIIAAIENGISKLPALEGRFPQVSNIVFAFDRSLPEGKRVTEISIGGAPVDPEKKYVLATRGYMAKGKDGFESLTKEEGDAEDVVDEENGILISMILRQYFLSLKVLGKWKRGGAFRNFFGGLKDTMHERGDLVRNEVVKKREDPEAPEHSDEESGSDDEEDNVLFQHQVAKETQMTKEEKVKGLVQRAGAKWARLAGVKKGASDEDVTVDWTSSISPKLEGRIKEVTK